MPGAPRWGARQLPWLEVWPEPPLEGWAGLAEAGGTVVRGLPPSGVGRHSEVRPPGVERGGAVVEGTGEVVAVVGSVPLASGVP